MIVDKNICTRFEAIDQYLNTVKVAQPKANGKFEISLDKSSNSP